MSSPAEKTDYCRHSYIAGAVADNKLYVSGGFIILQPEGGNKTWSHNNFVRAIDLSSAFLLSSREEAPVEYVEVRKLPDVSEHSMWSYNNTIYQFGGRSERSNTDYPGQLNAEPINTMWQYNPRTDEWRANTNIFTASGTSIVRSYSAMTVAVQSLGKAYQLAGECCNSIEKSVQEVRGMLVHDFETDGWEWTDQLWDFASDGTLVHVPQGDQGFLVQVGGRGPTNWNGFLPIDQIGLYNVADDKFGRRQLSTAVDTSRDNGLPELRANHCAVVASAPDGSSHNIYVFGGINGALKDVDGDVWVLSIPSFQWFRIPSVGDEYNPGTRNGHICNVVGEGGRMMMLYGGQSNDWNDPDQACDETGIYMFDMTELKWVERYDPDEAAKEYKVPKVIYDVIGGDANGGADKMPEKGIADEKIRALFEKKSPGESSGGGGGSRPTDSDPQNGGLPGEDGDGDSGSSNTGAIAGGVAGGLVFLALLIGIWFLLKRRKRRAAGGDLAEMPNSVAPTGELAAGDNYYNNNWAEMPGKGPVHEVAVNPVRAEMPATNDYYGKVEDQNAISPVGGAAAGTGYSEEQYTTQPYDTQNQQQYQAYQSADNSTYDASQYGTYPAAGQVSPADGSTYDPAGRTFDPVNGTYQSVTSTAGDQAPGYQQRY